MTGRLHQLYFRVIRYSPPIDPRGNGIEMLNFFLIVSQLKTIRIGWFDANSHLSYRHRDIEEYVNVRSTHNIQISSHLQTLIHKMCARPYGPRRDCICRLMTLPAKFLESCTSGCAVWRFKHGVTIAFTLKAPDKAGAQIDWLGFSSRDRWHCRQKANGSSPLNTGCAAPYFEYRC
jgi:hypothetical protein